MDGGFQTSPPSSHGEAAQVVNDGRRGGRASTILPLKGKLSHPRVAQCSAWDCREGESPHSQTICAVNDDLIRVCDSEVDLQGGFLCQQTHRSPAEFCLKGKENLKSTDDGRQEYNLPYFNPGGFIFFDAKISLQMSCNTMCDKQHLTPGNIQASCKKKKKCKCVA